MIVVRRGQRVSIPDRLTHVHNCGHRDGCYLMPATAAAEPCKQCRRDALNKQLAADYRAKQALA